MTRLLQYIAHHAAKQYAGQCGPTALRNALLRYERLPLSEFKSPRRGCDERCISKLALRHGYSIEHFSCSTPGMCRAQLRWWARRNVPVLTCCDRDSSGPWSHWIAIVHSTARHVYVCDSDADVVLQRVTWSKFLSRAVTVTHTDDRHTHTRFDLYGVICQS